MAEFLFDRLQATILTGGFVDPSGPISIGASSALQHPHQMPQSVIRVHPHGHSICTLGMKTSRLLTICTWPWGTRSLLRSHVTANTTCHTSRPHQRENAPPSTVGVCSALASAELPSVGYVGCCLIPPHLFLCVSVHSPNMMIVPSVPLYQCIQALNVGGVALQQSSSVPRSECTCKAQTGSRAGVTHRQQGGYLVKAHM